MKKLLLLSMLLFAISGCKTNSDTEEWDTNEIVIIGSKKVIGWVPKVEHKIVDSLYATKTTVTDKDWKAFSSAIEGFNYQYGYEYVVNINTHHKKVYQDGEILIYYQTYKLKEIESKVKKSSENIPADFYYGNPPQNQPNKIQ